MDTLLGYLFVGAVIVVLLAWSWHFHFWSNSPTARRSRTPLSLGLTATAASALFLIAGVIGFNLDKHSRFVAGTAWTGGVIMWEVVVGLLLIPLAIYFFRRGVRDIRQKRNSLSR